MSSFAEDDSEDFNPNYDTEEDQELSKEEETLFAYDEHKPWFGSPHKNRTKDAIEYRQAVAELDGELTTLLTPTASFFLPQGLVKMVTKLFHSPPPPLPPPLLSSVHGGLEGDDKENGGGELKTIQLAWRTATGQVRSAKTAADLRKPLPVLRALSTLCVDHSELLGKLGETEETVGEFVVSTWAQWCTGEGQGEEELGESLLRIVRGLELKPFITNKLVPPASLLKQLHSSRWRSIGPKPSKRQRHSV
ncbi:hypothetical protein BASA81_000548 [Batrachochytrium salamandrivorans]|nr:hypothetical protein BASA81_000548 [Batrachochytrium salamandrivorans]